MPLPRVVARINTRYTNRFIEPVVRRTAGFTVVHHVGRRSGRSHRPPLYSFRRGDAVLVALTYGPNADWAQSVLAKLGALDRDEARYQITAASIVDRSVA